MQELGLSDEQRLICDAMHTLARERFAPGAAASDRHSRPPLEACDGNSFAVALC